MPSNVIPAIPASQLVNVVPSVLAAGGSPLQFWGMIVDSNIGANGYPLMPMGLVLLYADTQDVSGYFGSTSQEAGLADVYFTGPINATKTPSGLLMTQYALNAVPAYLRGGNTSGLSLGQLQAIDASLSLTIDGTTTTETVNLASATSFSNAAEIIGAAFASLKGVQKGTFTASLSGTTMTVSALTASNSNGALQATVTASLSGTTMTVTSVTGGYLEVGQVVVGTGISAGTTIASWNGGGVPGGVGSYTLSASVTTESAETITAYAPAPVIALGDLVTGTGITAGTYVSAFGTGAGGAGTYTLSQSATNESAEAINQYAPLCSYSPLHGSFDIHSGSTGAGSSVAFATGAAAASLLLTQATGAVQSPGAAASTPTAFMNGVVAQTQNWVSFMTSWEPTDADKATNAASSFAAWVNAQDGGYRYPMWETSILDTEAGSGPSAAVAAINEADYSGTIPIYTNPAVTTLAGEKAAFSMSWAASLDFTRLNGRQTAAFKSYVGGLPDVTNGTVAEVLAGAPQSGTFGYGINFYGLYTTRSQGFPEYQRGTVSGPFVWDDTYTDQIWLNNALQNAIMIGLSQANSVPYANPGYAEVESWCLDPILAAVNFGAIVAGVELSQAQAQAVNQAAGIEIDQTLTQRGWYLQVQPATAATRAVRSSPPCTLWWTDGGSIQSITLASITVQ